MRCTVLRDRAECKSLDPLPASNYSELRQGDDFFRKTKRKLKPKPALESPRPGAADSGGKPIKSALAGLGSLVHLADVPKILRGKFIRVLQGHYMMHSNTTTARRSAWELKTLHTSTNDRISHRKPTTGTTLPLSGVRMSPARKHAIQNNVPHARGLFVHATAASSGVCAPQA
jgi:hypothetical protein